MSNVNSDENLRRIEESRKSSIDGANTLFKKADAHRERLAEIAAQDRAKAENRRLTLQQQVFKLTLAMFKGG